MGFIVGGVIAGVGAYAGSKKQSSAAWHAANAAQVQAWQEQVANENLAKAQKEQTAALQTQQQNFEVGRQEAQNRFDTERQAAAEAASKEAAAAAEASAKQNANDLALSVQNQRVSDLTPTVQLNAQGDDASSAASARKRRASFRPEYTSGVTI